MIVTLTRLDQIRYRRIPANTKCTKHDCHANRSIVQMATKLDFTIVKNTAGKSAVWSHFGFVKQNDELDKTKVACRICFSIFKYSGNTTNLTDHLKRKHPTFAQTGERSQVKSEPSSGSSLPRNIQTSKSSEQKLQNYFAPPYTASSQRAKSITAAVAQFIVKDLRPFNIVENLGFQNMIAVLDPRYNIPSRPHFSGKVIPELYEKVSSQVRQDLRGNYVAITTDGWTSRATESYVTITSSHIDENWDLKNYVLQVNNGFKYVTKEIFTFLASYKWS